MEEFSRMLAGAMRAKGEARGAPYTLRDLSGDSGLHFAYIGNVVKGRRHPSVDAVRQLVGALSPYMRLDEALLAAGHAPDTPAVVRMVRDILRLSMDRWAELERWVGEQVTAEEADGQAKRKRRRKQADHEPAAETE